jgi:hypothetical protein
MTLAQMIAAARAALGEAITARAATQDALMALRADPDNLTEELVAERAQARDNADQLVTQRQRELDELEAEQVRENEIAEMQRRVEPTGAHRNLPAYDRVVRVGAEGRTYRADTDRRGVQFAGDVAAAFLGDFTAQERLARHMQEERVERGALIQERAVGTGAFAGLVVPQYLTDMFAPMAQNGRPFADAMRRHTLPANGMTVNIGRATTGTSAALQASEGAAVSETDFDDTLLTINVQTAAGAQTVSRQGVDRGVNVEDTILEDLYGRHATVIDSTILNQATTGLAAAATAVTYTDASPTTAELYPKVIEGLSGVEAAMLNQASGDNLAVMHSRRWYWMQNAMGTSYPLITQPGVIAQTLGANYAEAYGRGVRGILPNGTPVIVDNNVGTTLGAGTEDEIYLVDRRECHLWEDPSAPFFIRAEQPGAKNLQIQLVVYSYFAYTHIRYAHARKISGTGLIAPTFTGV